MAMKVSDPTYFVLKRLHSLTGIVPIGLFLLEHLFTNSKALQGAVAFDQAAAELARIPYVTLVEAIGIWLPIAFHMVLGVIIATTAQANVGQHGYARNWQYTLQRLSGIVLVFYILFHTWMTRFDPNYLHSPSAYAFVHDQVVRPGVFIFYVVGILSACWHFGNGLFGFAIHWGLATGVRGQRLAARLAFGTFVVLSIVGLNALFAFAGFGFYPDWFSKPHAGEHSTVVYQEGAR
jgi:succinate dehydrogenase / fumarate reductase cytochrome b subunit